MKMIKQEKNFSRQTNLVIQIFNRVDEFLEEFIKIQEEAFFCQK